jgi:hypothetical protein
MPQYVCIKVTNTVSGPLKIDGENMHVVMPIKHFEKLTGVVGTNGHYFGLWRRNLLPPASVFKTCRWRMNVAHKRR